MKWIYFGITPNLGWEVIGVTMLLAVVYGFWTIVGWAVMG